MQGEHVAFSWSAIPIKANLMHSENYNINTLLLAKCSMALYVFEQKHLLPVMIQIISIDLTTSHELATIG
jgi:hypothetical protein